MPTDSAPLDSNNAPPTCRSGAEQAFPAPPFAATPFFPVSEPLSGPSCAPTQESNFLAMKDPGYDFRVDNFSTLMSFPAVLANGIWVMTAQADAGNTDAAFLSFSVADRPVEVYVAYDAAATRLPGWLDPATSAFVAVDGQVVTSDGNFTLFKRAYAAGESVVLGGNAASGARNALLMYVPIVVDRTAPSPA